MAKQAPACHCHVLVHSGAAWMDPDSDGVETTIKMCSMCAAAPALLAALKLQEALETAAADPADTRWKDARNMRRAAIRAAEGE